MANGVIAHIADNALVLWTDANPTDQEFSRRNIAQIGPHCVAIHDDVVTWLPILTPVFADPDLASLAVEDLATKLAERLKELAKSTPNDLGVIIAGFRPSGGALLQGLHSGREFAVLRFSPGVVGNLPPTLYDYLTSTLQSIPQTVEDVVDEILIMGDAYHEVLLRHYGLARACAITVLRPGLAAAWLSDDDIQRRRERNNRRMHALQLGITRYFAELRQ